MAGSSGLLDRTPHGRGEAREDEPEGWPEGRHACRYRRSDADGNATRGPTSRPCRSGPVPARPLWRPWAGTAPPLPPEPSSAPDGQDDPRGHDLVKVRWVTPLGVETASMS